MGVFPWSTWRSGLVMAAFAGAVVGCNSQPTATRMGDEGVTGHGGAMAVVGVGGHAPEGVAGTSGAGADGAAGSSEQSSTDAGAQDPGAPDASAPPIDAAASSMADADAGVETCQPGSARCEEGCVVTCQSNGVWGPIVKCGGRKTCSEAGGTAHCVCKEDRACLASGTNCTSQSTMSTCERDADGCFFETAPLETCASGACLGLPGRATCCATSCAGNPTRCEDRGDNAVLGTCTIGPDGCATFTQSQCAAGTVCERIAPASCVDPQWAEWPMPNGREDVLLGAPNLASYTDNLDHTVTDNVTGLVWEETAIAFDTFDEADTFCRMLVEGGSVDWRLPTFIELVSIADFGSQFPSIDGNFFPAQVDPPFWDYWVWSSTPGAFQPGTHYTINYGRGEVVPLADASDIRRAAARCVH